MHSSHMLWSSFSLGLQIFFLIKKLECYTLKSQMLPFSHYYCAVILQNTILMPELKLYNCYSHTLIVPCPLTVPIPCFFPKFVVFLQPGPKIPVV